MVELLDLPSELMFCVVTKLPATSLSKLSKVNRQLRELVRETRTLWAHRAKTDFGLALSCSEEEKNPREIYQTILHKFGPVFGLWQRTDLRHYGQLMKIYFDGKGVVFSALWAPSTVHGSLIEKRMLNFRILDEECKLKVEKEFLYNVHPGSIHVTYDSKGVFCEDDEVMTISEYPVSEDKMLVIHQKVEDFKNINLFLNSMVKSRDLNDEMGSDYFDRRNRSLFYSKEVSFYRKFKEAYCENSSFPSGLFAGHYSLHGTELINVEVGQDHDQENFLLKGVKVTGDPNIPFDKVTFLVKDRWCLNVSSEEQRTVGGMKEAMARHELVEFTEDLSLPFTLPQDCTADGDFPLGYTSCKGRWGCEVQVAWDNYEDPKMIPGQLIMFSKNEFAVIFLDLYSISLYKKINIC